VVIPPEPDRNFEVVVARYYLGDRRIIVPMKGELVDDALQQLGPIPGQIFFSVSMRRQAPAGIVPLELDSENRSVRFRDFRESLRLIEIRVGGQPAPSSP
jgi:hypothetical protein